MHLEKTGLFAFLLFSRSLDVVGTDADRFGTCMYDFLLAFHGNHGPILVEYHLRLGRQRQVWLIPIADERVGVQVKL